MSNPSTTVRGGISTVIAVVVFLAAAVFLSVAWVSSIRSIQVRHGWERTLGTPEEVFARFPSVEANASALEVERLAGLLGIDVVPRNRKDRQPPAQAPHDAYQAARNFFFNYLKQELERPYRDIATPPEPLLRYLAQNREALEDLKRHLRGGEVSRWGREIEKLSSAPLPNLLGHLQIQRLLVVDALNLSRQGNHAGALETFEASWRFTDSLRGEPMLISQLIAMAETRWQAGLLRQLEDVPVSWRNRLFEHDFRESFVTAMLYEGWVWSKIGGELASTWGQQNVLQEALGVIGKPYFEFCAAEVSDGWRKRLENLSEVEFICDADLSKHQADLELEVPRWNLVGDMMVSNLANAVDRLASLELDLEMTAKLVAIQGARIDGRWPAAIPEIEHSVACPEDRWIYEVDTDGEMSLAFHREISWPGIKGPILPKRYQSQPAG